jgi:hypothetical protein
MAKNSVLSWGDRLRWVLVGGVVIGGPVLGLWIFLSAFPRMKSGTAAAPQELSDPGWLKLRDRLAVGDLCERPRWLRNRIHFDHGLDFWLSARSDTPTVTAVVRGDYTDAQLEAIAKHAASLAFLAFHRANRSLTLHLWNDRIDGHGGLVVRHCTADFTITLRERDGATDFDANCKAAVADSAYSRPGVPLHAARAIGY